jgi:DNA repair protein RAD5
VIQTAKAVYELDGLYRWCLTGTPIQNNLTDLFSLVHFIRYTPWAEYECWNKYINRPSEAGDENVYEVLRTILKRVFLRRTKQTKDHLGRPIVILPTKISKIELLQMDEKERQFYDSIYECSRSTIEELERQGIL